MQTNIADVPAFLKDFSLTPHLNLISHEHLKKTIVEQVSIGDTFIPRYVNEFWTSQQRKALPLHEISYRACFKPQLPRFFINLLTREGDVVYDPFSGRGTTVIEAGLLGRNVISNDINPLSEIMAAPRFLIPDINNVIERLSQIHFDHRAKADLDLSMFYHPETEAEIVSLKNYLRQRRIEGKEDFVDRWIRMVATNRLTGHSSGFFSVYTLPPNQAVSPESQIKINQKRGQTPPYRDVCKIIVRKTNSLIRDLTQQQRTNLASSGARAMFLKNDARTTPEIRSGTVQLTVTSPPFLDIVQYSKDNWLRCWFNSIDDKKISKKITMSKTIEDWRSVMGDVFKELFRITKKGGWVAFEVGEVRKGSLKLDEHVIPLGCDAGFVCQGVMINNQKFTKTSNIWGINNNRFGTNTNRIVIFKKI